MSDNMHAFPKMEWPCIARSKRLAVLCLAYAAPIAAGSWYNIGKPFPAGPPWFLNRLVLVDATLALAYIFLYSACVYERVWVAFAVAGFGISLAESFYPAVVAPVIGRLRLLDFALSLALVAVSVVVLAHAVRRGTPPATGRQGSGPAAPAPSKARYAWLYLGAAASWAAAFYALGSAILHISLHSVTFAYLLLVVLSGIGLLAGYRWRQVPQGRPPWHDLSRAVVYLGAALAATGMLVVLYPGPLNQGMALPSCAIAWVGALATVAVSRRVAVPRRPSASGDRPARS